jgi:competence protein ComEA
MVACAALLFVPIYLKSRTSQGSPASAAFHVLSSSRILVKVSGDVRHPGIYEVPDNALASAVINMAGMSGGQELGKFDPTITLRNGSTVNVKRLADGSSQVTVGKIAVSERMILRIPLEIATMNEEDFDRLPGIGPALAKRIVEYRQNNGGILRLEDLAMIEGIGEKKYEMIRRYIQHPVNTK